MRQDSVVRVDKRVEDTAMVWPHLLVIEFIAAMLWSIGLFVIAAAFNATLQDHATPDCTTVSFWNDPGVVFDEYW